MTIRQTATKAYNALDNIFSDTEAWGLFRVSAFLETFGWTGLIIGIIAVKLQWPHNDAVLAVSGSIHGILFIFYIFIVIFAHRSMKWSVWRFLFAGSISVVPYGALLFELWVSRRRRQGKV